MGFLASFIDQVVEEALEMTGLAQSNEFKRRRNQHLNPAPLSAKPRLFPLHTAPVSVAEFPQVAG